jgi:hypothetical protein
VLLVRTLAHPWDTHSPALCRVRVEWVSVLLDQQPSLLPLRRRACRLCSNDSSVLCRCPTPRRRTCGPYGLSLLPPSCDSLLPQATARSPGSCTKFLGVSGVFDYAGLSRSSRYRACSCCLPCITKTSASGLHLFGAEYHPAYPLSTLHWVPRSSSARLDAETDRYSFLVRLLYPLLHAGLPRCTIIGIVSPTTMMVGFRPNCGFLGSVSMDRVPSLISMM